MTESNPRAELMAKLEGGCTALSVGDEPKSGRNMMASLGKSAMAVTAAGALLAGASTGLHALPEVGDKYGAGPMAFSDAAEQSRGSEDDYDQSQDEGFSL